MVADEPVPAVRLATALALPTARVEDAPGRARGGVPRRGAAAVRAGSSCGAPATAGGSTRRPVYADVVGRFVLDGQTARLTQAALETLAVVAYRQPVTRGQVSAVRGVNVDGVMRTLTTRGLVAEVGTDPASGAVLYGTTGYFLERMGLSSLGRAAPAGAVPAGHRRPSTGVDQAIGDTR